MFEIYFNDLTEQAQKEFLKYVELDSAKDGNYDLMPIAVIDIKE